MTKKHNAGKEVILHGDSGGCLINWDGIHIIQVWIFFII